MDAGAGHAAGRGLLERAAPCGEPGRDLVGEIALDMQQLAQFAAVDQPDRLGDRREIALVGADAERHPGVAARPDRPRGAVLGQRQWLFAEHRLAGARGRDDLVDMPCVRGRQHHRLDRAVGQHLGKVAAGEQMLRLQELAVLRRVAADRAGKADFVALALHRLDQGAAPAAEPDDCRVDHLSLRDEAFRHTQAGTAAGNMSPCSLQATMRSRGSP